MRTWKRFICMIIPLLLLAACSTAPTPQTSYPDAVEIVLGDDGIQADGAPIGTDAAQAVYTAQDIVYYASGMDFTYGEGTDADAHSPEEAAAHTVVHIGKAGTYRLSGKLSQGQIAVDLGEDAKKDPNAVVTLIFDGADITCNVAPAVIFYNVYECGSDDTETASKDVDTAAAGANVIIADGAVNTVNGSYVARIYKSGTVELNEDGTAVEDAKKLHKYDGAFYSKMSMNMSGGETGTGVLNVFAENEGIDSELHLTINGGIINIDAGNDGINTNEDGVSVTTVNGGCLNIKVSGETGEGDGIDSNGWLVINGGSVTAQACADSADAGIDSDMGIHINGGTVMASGHMLDRIEDGGQTYAVFQFAQQQAGGRTLCLKNASGKTVMEVCPENAYSVLICADSALTEGVYTLWCDGEQLTGQNGMGGGMGFMPGGMRPDGMGRPALPDGFAPPTDGQRPMGTPPEGMERPEGEVPFDGKRPESFEELPEKPNGNGPFPGSDKGFGAVGGETAASADFRIVTGANQFFITR